MATTIQQRPLAEVGGLEAQPKRRAQLHLPSGGVNQGPAKVAPLHRLLLGLLGLFVVYVTMSLAVLVVAPAVGLGWTPVVISSGSMSPFLRIGDVVVASPHDGRGLSPGTVVVFSDPARPGLLTHRIESTNPDGSYMTKGDANGQPDSTPLRPEQVVGVGRLLIPLIGWPLVWFWAAAWAALAVWAAGTLLALWVARHAFLEKYDPRSQPEVSSRLGTAVPAFAHAPERRVQALPMVRRLARDLGVDITTIKGSGPEGRITHEDVLAASEPIFSPKERSHRFSAQRSVEGGFRPWVASMTPKSLWKHSS